MTTPDTTPHAQSRDAHASHRAAYPGTLAMRIAVGLSLGLACWTIWAQLGVASAAGLEDEWPIAGCALLGALLGARHRFLALTLTAASGSVLFLMVSYTPLAAVAARALVRRDATPAERPDAVVVLGAGVTGDGLLRAAALERLLTGLSLVAPADSTPFVVSAVRVSPTDSTTSDRDLTRLVALAGGRRTIWLTNVYSTHDEAMQVRSLSLRRGWHTVVVVTSPSHSRRACATFERTGLRVTCVPSEERSFRLTRASSPHERLLAWDAVVYEVLGRIAYRWRGWA